MAKYKVVVELQERFVYYSLEIDVRLYVSEKPQRKRKGVGLFWGDETRGVVGR